MLLRPYRPGDDEGVQETVKEAYDEYGFLWDTENDVDDLFSLQESFVEPARLWVVEDSTSQIVACCGIQFHSPAPGPEATVVFHNDDDRISGTTAELVRLYVRKSARRHGLATRLTNQVIDYAKEHGVTLLEIWSDKELHDAHRLYERFGAIRVGDRYVDGADPYEEWGYLLRLDQFNTGP